VNTEIVKIEKSVEAKPKAIFLSHAAKDKVLADKLADLLTSGCAVNPNDILCTSLEGKGIPAGSSSFIKFLHGQIQNPKLVILLLTENFFASQFCMCELGAVWGMELDNFPLVVPPIERGKLKAVLTVAQTGEINNPASLDELRDAVKKLLGAEVPTATWTVKRDAFQGGLDEIIKSLERPGLVSAEELKAAKESYLAAMAEIGNKEKETKALKAQIADLEKCKDREQVNAVNRKYSSDQEQFEKLVGTAKTALQKIGKATAKAVFCDLRGECSFWEGEDEWYYVEEASQLQEIEIFHEQNSFCKPKADHIRVKKAQDALRDLDVFFKDESHYDFVAKLEEQFEFPINLGNKEFWGKILNIYI
jgi:hypothetical protein